MPAPDTLNPTPQDGGDPERRSEGGHPIAGRWTWVPDGWRVVPEEPTAEMRSELRRVSLSHVDAMWRAGCVAAPKPPSPWKQGKWLEETRVLLWFPQDARMEVGWAPYPHSWYAPLPPGPEEDKP